MFVRSKIMTIFNLYYYVTALEGMKIIKFSCPPAICNLYTISQRSKRLILPKIHFSEVMCKSFIYNSKRILNYLLEHDIKYHEISVNNFKQRLKRHLLFNQGISVNGEDSWLPCNHDIFSDITVF